MVYEKSHEPVASMKKFVWRVLSHFCFVIVFVGVALSIGIWGLHDFENLPWVTAFSEASMILSGVGPSAPITSQAGQIFAGIYSLFSGLVFLSIVGIIFAPFIHRFFHRFHTK